MLSGDFLVSDPDDSPDASRDLRVAACHLDGLAQDGADAEQFGISDPDGLQRRRIECGVAIAAAAESMRDEGSSSADVAERIGELVLLGMRSPTQLAIDAMWFFGLATARDSIGEVACEMREAA